MLKESGVRIITLANFSPSMLRSNAENAGILPCFDVLVSTDANHTYKPDARAYRPGMDQLHLAKSEIAFAAFGGWDAGGCEVIRLPNILGESFQPAARGAGYSV